METGTNKKYKYLSLTPKELETDDINVALLIEKVADKDIKNIAIMAPYGAGKSSVLRTFEKEHGINKYINVSLASFNSDDEFYDNADGEQQDIDTRIINDIDNKIEKSILQQILYKKEKKDLPKSNIRRIGRPSFGQILFMFFCVLLGVIAIGSSVLFSLQISGIKLFDITNQAYFAIALVSAFICVTGLILGRKISKLSYGDLDVVFSEEEKESLLNKFLNEIIYFFQKTNYDTVIFEDLDRFNNLGIFVKLRELNILLNNNEVIAQKHKITFVYAINNAVFRSHKDRTKFFDFILPLVPVLSPLNVKDDLVESLKESGLGADWLTSEFIYDISQYIKEKRVLNSIINDCITMMNVLDFSKIPGGELQQKHDQLFALMAYKNIQPQEFAKLENNEGELVEIIDKAHTFALKNIDNIDNIIQQKNNQIETCRQTAISSLNQIRMMVKGFLITKIRSAANGVAIESINDIPQDKNAWIYCSANYYHSATILEIEQGLGISSLKQLWDSVKLKESGEIKEIEEKIQELRREKNNATTDGFNYLQNHSEEVFSKIKVTALLQMLLVNQYITEYYRDFIGKTGEEFLSANDRMFVRFVVEDGEPNFELKLTSPELILRDLSDKKFGRKAMLNRNIIDLIFSSQKISHTQKQQFCNLLLKDDKLVEACLVQYFDKSNDWTSNFVKFLIGNRCDFLDVLKLNTSKESLAKILTFILENIDANDISHQKNRAIYNEVLSENVDIMSSICAKNSTLEFLKQVGFKFNQIDGCNDVEALKQIEKYNLWQINSSNLLHLIQTRYNNTDENALSKGLTLINKMINGTAEYIKENINYYIREILLIQENIDMDESTVLDCMGDEAIDLSARCKIASKIKNPIPYNSTIKIEIVTALLEADKVMLKCEEIAKLIFEHETINEMLCVYLYNHRNEISLQFQLLEPLVYLIANCHQKFTIDGNQVSLYKIYKENLESYNWKIIKLDNDDLICKIVVASNSFTAESMKHIIEGDYPKSLVELVKKNIDAIITNNLCNYKVAFNYFVFGDNKTKKESSIIMQDLLHVKCKNEAKQIFEKTINERIKLTADLRKKLISLGVDADRLFESQIEYLSKAEALSWAKEIDPSLEPLEREGFINGTMNLNDSIIIQSLNRMKYTHRVGKGLLRYKIEVL